MSLVHWLLYAFLYCIWLWNYLICSCVIVRQRSHMLIVRRKMVPATATKYFTFSFGNLWCWIVMHFNTFPNIYELHGPSFKTHSSTKIIFCKFENGVRLCTASSPWCWMNWWNVWQNSNKSHTSTLVPAHDFIFQFSMSSLRDYEAFVKMKMAAHATAVRPHAAIVCQGSGIGV